MLGRQPLAYSQISPEPSFPVVPKREQFHRDSRERGARLVEEQRSLCTLFSQHFPGRLESASWANSVLRGRSVAAVDGSQLASSSLHGYPLAFVSISCYLNHHQESRFHRESILRLVLPDPGFGHVSDSRMNFARTFGELQRVEELIGELGERRASSDPEGSEQGEPRPLVFFDGSLIFSFASQLGQDEQEAYGKELHRLLSRSREQGVLLVGLVDTSLAHDLTDSLLAFGQWKDGKKSESIDTAIPGQRVPDSVFYNKLLLHWGDRSPVFHSLRRGVLQENPEAENEDIHFCYLRTSLSSTPARLEFPAWVSQKGLVQELVDVVLAQCVAGRGYPLTLKKAHDLAVITTRNREQLYRLVRTFLNREGMEFATSSKSLLKEQ